jgi:hypothetical protein
MDFEEGPTNHMYENLFDPLQPGPVTTSDRISRGTLAGKEDFVEPGRPSSGDRR